MKEEYKNNDTPPEQEEKEIDLLELGLRLWYSRKRILLWGCIGVIIGVIIALSYPKEYIATVKLIPEVGESRTNNNLGALAALAGVNVSGQGGSEAMGPNMYPEIVSSIPFTVELFSVNLPIDEPGDTLTLREIITARTARPWWSFFTSIPGKIGGALSNKKSSTSIVTSTDSVIPKINPFHLTKGEEGIAGAIRSRVSADIDKGILTITVMLQDATASAHLADTVAERLQEYIKDYRTGKARNDLEYVEKLNAEAQEDYYSAQQEYAKFIDRNQGLSNRTAALEQERLQNEMQLAFNLYNSTSQQVQLAKAKVQSSTPIFTVVQPSTIPNSPSKPRVMFIIIGCVFLSVIASCALILFFPGIKTAIKEKKDQNIEQIVR